MKGTESVARHPWCLAVLNGGNGYWYGVTCLCVVPKIVRLKFFLYIFFTFLSYSQFYYIFIPFMAKIVGGLILKFYKCLGVVLKRGGIY